MEFQITIKIDQKCETKLTAFFREVLRPIVSGSSNSVPEISWSVEDIRRALSEYAVTPERRENAKAILTELSGTGQLQDLPEDQYDALMQKITVRVVE